MRPLSSRIFYMGAPFEWEGEAYPSAEHAFQAAKCARPADRRLFALCMKPGEAKRLGKRVSLCANWEQVKMGIMEAILRAKFASAGMRARLDATGTCEIIHANNWHDQFWGDCVCTMHPAAGENHLGRLLMKIREEGRINNR